MAIVLEANYAKKLGLPNFSSHQYSVTIRTELSDLSQVQAESSRLYRLLQDAVDREIEEVGFLPDATTYGMHPSTNGSAGNGANGDNGNGNGHYVNGNGSSNGNGNGAAWKCSDKQREFLERIIGEHQLDKHDIERKAQQMFGAGVKQLNRLQMSGLIDDLLEEHGKGGHRNGNGNRRFQRRQRAGVE